MTTPITYTINLGTSGTFTVVRSGGNIVQEGYTSNVDRKYDIQKNTVSLYNASSGAAYFEDISFGNVIDGSNSQPFVSLAAIQTYIKANFIPVFTGNSSSNALDPSTPLTTTQATQVDTAITGKGYIIGSDATAAITAAIAAKNASNISLTNNTLPDPITSNLNVGATDAIQLGILKIQQQLKENARKLALQNKSNFFEKLRSNLSYTIECVGDSLTYSQDDTVLGSGTLNGATQKRSIYQWPEMMGTILTQAGFSPTIINHGYPGDRTIDSIGRWYKSGRAGTPAINQDTTTDVNLVNELLVPKTVYDAVIISLSHNDSQNYGLKSSGIVNIPNFKQNLIQMVLANLNAGSWVQLGMMPLPLIYSGGNGSVHAQINNYRAAIKEVANEFGLDIIDFQQILQPLFPIWQSDAVHLLSNGYNHMGCMAAARFISDYIPKVGPGEAYYFYDQMFPFTSVNSGGSSTKGNLMTMSTSKFYPMVFEVVGEKLELCFKSYNSNTTGFNVSYGNNVTVPDVLIPATGTLKKSRTGMIFPRGIHLVMLSNPSATNQTFPDEIKFESGNDPNVTTITDADYVMSGFRSGGVFYDGAMTAGRNLTLASNQGREAEWFIWANTTTFARTIAGSILLKTLAGVTITTIPAGTAYTIRVINGTYYKIS